MNNETNYYQNGNYPNYPQNLGNGVYQNPYQAPQSKKNIGIIIGVLVGIVVVVLVIMLLSKNEKTLTCTNTYDGGDYGKITRTMKVTLNKKGDEVKKLTQTLTAEYGSSYDEDSIADAYEDAQGECEEYDGAKSIKCTTKRSGKQISQTITVDYSKLTESESEKYDVDYDEFEGEDYDSLRQEAEDGGYTCK